MAAEFYNWENLTSEEIGQRVLNALYDRMAAIAVELFELEDDNHDTHTRLKGQQDMLAFLYFEFTDDDDYGYKAEVEKRVLAELKRAEERALSNTAHAIMQKAGHYY